ncbi:MAG TPA: hypothetical protein VIZ66_09175 [Sphingomicrobium sp.]
MALLTNGVIYKFFTDVDTPNRMDDKPFFTFSLEQVRKQDLKTLESFTKQAFDVDRILNEAGNLKTQSLVMRELQTEFQEPSEEFVRLIAGKVHSGRLTGQIKEKFRQLIINSVSSLIRERVNERLNSALTATNPADEDEGDGGETEATFTTQEEVDGFNIVRAIGSRLVETKRIVMRDAKSYCAILLDDNNRKTIARLHFNSPTARYLGTFQGKDEHRSSVSEPTDIYKHEAAILKRIEELLGQK